MTSTERVAKNYDLDASYSNVQTSHPLDRNGIKFGFHRKNSKITF